MSSWKRWSKTQRLKKVLVVCNKDYAENANCCKGGVGTESTIMSDDIYSKAEQIKFISVIFEKWDNQEIYTPHFMKSRMVNHLMIT